LIKAARDPNLYRLNRSGNRQTVRQVLYADADGGIVDAAIPLRRILCDAPPPLPLFPRLG